jgi:hypothetical protein
MWSNKEKRDQWINTIKCVGFVFAVSIKLTHSLTLSLMLSLHVNERARSRVSEFYGNSKDKLKPTN